MLWQRGNTVKNTDQFKNTECCAQYGARLVMKSVICPRRDGAAVEDERQPRKIIIINMLLLNAVLIEIEVQLSKETAPAHQGAPVKSSERFKSVGHQVETLNQVEAITFCRALKMKMVRD